MYWLARLQRLYQVRPLRMLDTAKKRDVTRRILNVCSGVPFCQKGSRRVVLGIGNGLQGQSARRSAVKNRRPIPPSGCPPSSVKMFTGISTLAPVPGIAYFRHSALPANPTAGIRLKTTRPSRVLGTSQASPFKRYNPRRSTFVPGLGHFADHHGGACERYKTGSNRNHCMLRWLLFGGAWRGTQYAGRQQRWP